MKRSVLFGLGVFSLLMNVTSQSHAGVYQYFSCKDLYQQLEIQLFDSNYWDPSLAPDQSFEAKVLKAGALLSTYEGIKKNQDGTHYEGGGFTMKAVQERRQYPAANGGVKAVESWREFVLQPTGQERDGLRQVATMKVKLPYGIVPELGGGCKWVMDNVPYGDEVEVK